MQLSVFVREHKITKGIIFTCWLEHAKQTELIRSLGIHIFHRRHVYLKQKKCISTITVKPCKPNRYVIQTCTYNMSCVPFITSLRSRPLMTANTVVDLLPTISAESDQDAGIFR